MIKIKKTASGFTLLEILITLAISGFVIAAALKTFDYSNKSYIVQEDIAQMQQNARMAKYYIERDLRIAGYGIDNGVDILGEVIIPLSFANEYNSSNKTDLLSISYIDDEAASCGTTTPTGFTGNPCDTLPQITLYDKMPDTATTANIIEIMKSNPPFTKWVQNCWCGDYQYIWPGLGFMALITSPDGSKSNTFIVTGSKEHQTSGKSTIANGPTQLYNGDTYSKYDNKVVNTYPPGSTIKFINPETFITVNYFIDYSATDTAKEHPSLYREEARGTKKQAKTLIAENIEDFQVACFIDSDNDGVSNLEETTANKNKDWFQDASSVPAAMIDKIRFVKISILARTSREHSSSGLESTRPALEDHAAATTSDYYTRRPISVTVRARNLGL